MIEHVKVRQKLQFMRGNLKNLQQIAVLSYEEFTTQQFVLDASLRYLQVLIEAMLDIGSHITAREGYGIPQTYAHVIELLAKNHVIDADRKKTYLDMVRFRNRIVHMYTEVDPIVVYDIISNNLDDFESFMSSIVQRYFS